MKLSFRIKMFFLNRRNAKKIRLKQENDHIEYFAKLRREWADGKLNR